MASRYTAKELKLFLLHLFDDISLRQRRQIFRVDEIVIEMKLIHTRRNNAEQRASKAMKSGRDPYLTSLSNR